MNASVIVPSSPLKVNQVAQAGADAAQWILGTRSVEKPAMKLWRR